MTEKDGYVKGVTNVHDSGHELDRWNLVILGDGYTEVDPWEPNPYHIAVDEFVTHFRNTAPFCDLLDAINVFRVDVVSDEAGADEPVRRAAPDAPGGCGVFDTVNPGAEPRTYLDATFCSKGPGNVYLDRLLTVDDGLARAVAAKYVPYWSAVLVLVNSTKYGGSGGSVATCSAHPGSVHTALHELGHTVFELADEYGGDGTATPPAEPPEPNVTFSFERVGHKWGRFIGSVTPMPTECAPAHACAGTSRCVPPATPPPAGVVGTYEGAIYTDCNAYRPMPDCYMRTGFQFCAVCDDVIRTFFRPYLPPAPDPPGANIEISIAPDTWTQDTHWSGGRPEYEDNLPYYPPPNASPDYSWVCGKGAGRFVFRFSLPAGTPRPQGFAAVRARVSSAEWRVADDPHYSDVTVVLNGEPVGTARVLGLDIHGLESDWQNVPAELLLPGGFDNVIEFEVGEGEYANGLTFHYQARNPFMTDSPIKITVFR